MDRRLVRLDREQAFGGALVLIVLCVAALWAVLAGGGATASHPERTVASVPQLTGLAWQLPGDDPYEPPTTTTLPPLPPSIPYDDALWERLHRCEQPDSWYADGYNAADPGLRFQGGLGMSTQAWQMAIRAAANRGVDLPGSALSASVDQQKQGAQAFYEAHGWGWSCRV